VLASAPQKAEARSALWLGLFPVRRPSSPHFFSVSTHHPHLFPYLLGLLIMFMVNWLYGLCNTRWEGFDMFVDFGLCVTRVAFAIL
jgi:hypothetical protein